MLKEAYFAGGCFWCIAPCFYIDSITDFEVGYSGGDEVNPTYLDVKSQKTGHRESIKITYDDENISYKELIDIFLNNVDPFDFGGQYIDRGHSYTLAIYYQNEYEKELAEQYILEFEKESKKKVYVSIEKFKSFYRAEEMHQNYFLKNPEAFKKELIESGRIVCKEKEIML